MKLRRILTLALAMMLMATLLVCPASAYEAEVQETPKEVYLEPQQIGENLYAYYDEAGELLATKRVLTEEEYLEKTRAVVRNIRWSLPDGGYKHDTMDLDATEETIKIYTSIDFNRKGITYIGFYHPKYNQYTWQSDFFTDGIHLEITYASTDITNLALKNASGATMIYDGRYSLAPF